MDYYSSKNQDILSKLIHRDVYACISDMAESLFGFGEDGKYASYDEFYNFNSSTCPECGDVVDEWEINTGDEENGDLPVYECPHCNELFEEEPDYEYPEIYEYWIVSEHLGEKLRDLGGIVLERSLGWIWGRQCTGQAIYLDWIIGKIGEDMEILEGMKYEW